MSITINETNALNKAIAIGGYDAESVDAKKKAEQIRIENLLAEGGRTVDKVESVSIASYKLRFVPASALWLSIFKDELGAVYVTLKDADKAYRTYQDEKTTENRKAFEVARAALNAAFYALEQRVRFEALKPGAFVVSADKTNVRSNRRSLASDIAGVCYQHPGDQYYVDSKIVMLHHNTYEIVPKSWMLGKSNEEAVARSEFLCKNMIYSLIRKGVDLEFRYETLHYDFWASSSSHQKVGIAYFGESEMMKATEEIRNFGAGYEQINAAGGDNGAEYIKRQAVLFTPSDPITDPVTGEPLRLRDIAMFKDIDISRKSDNVANVSNNAEITVGEDDIGMTMADGQAMAICGWLKSNQMRGYGIKAFCVKADAATQYILPDPTVTDIDGNLIDIASIKIVMTKSCWKGSKLGYTWSQYVAVAERLAETCPGLDYLRCVRWADSAKDRQRYTSRQSTQQWILAMEKELEAMTSGAVRGLELRKTFSGALLYEAALNKPEEDRSAYNRAIEARPMILASEKYQTLLEDAWHNELAERASGRIKIRGMYPYIAMDPVAILQILLEGRDANDPDLGVLSDGQINLPNAEEGKEFYGVRYPNNFLCGMVFKQKNHDAFADVGEVAILPYHGFAIVRADGDFDGDEMLFTPNKLIVRMMKRVIDKINPPLIKFPHAKAERHIVDLKKTRMEIAIALYNGQAFNKVGQYSNVAMKLFSQIDISDENARFMSGIGREIILAHVATILVIDMVKTGTMPPKIKEAVENCGRQYKMPYSQRFMDHLEIPYWENPRCEEPTRCVADLMALNIVERCGEYTFDSESVEFDGSQLLCKVDSELTSISAGVVSDELYEKIKNYNASDEDNDFLLKVKAHERIGAKEMMLYFWRNKYRLFSALVSSADSFSDVQTAQEEYYAFVREAVLNHGDKEYWLELDEDTRRRLIYNYFITDAFELGRRGNGIVCKDNERQTLKMKALYAQFIVSVFAEDIVNYAKEE